MFSRGGGYYHISIHSDKSKIYCGVGSEVLGIEKGCGVLRNNYGRFQKSTIYTPEIKLMESIRHQTLNVCLQNA